MLLLEYKLRTNQAQRAAIDEAIRTVQFIRNKALRLWMDGQHVGWAEQQRLCAVLAKEYPFAARLHSNARQAAADRAWAAISRFYKNCRDHKPGKKGYPRFQRDNRSVKYKIGGWRLEADGTHLTFTDGTGMGTLRLMGTRSIETFPDAAWGQFLTRLRYYGQIANVPVVAVPPRFTSQDCSGCGERVYKSLSVRTLVCPACGLVLDRDHNAALNILDLALRTAGQAGTGSLRATNASGQGTSGKGKRLSSVKFAG